MRLWVSTVTDLFLARAVLDGREVGHGVAHGDGSEGRRREAVDARLELYAVTQHAERHGLLGEAVDGLGVVRQLLSRGGSQNNGPA